MEDGFYPNLINSDYAYSVFYHLRENTTWEDGVMTRQGGFTRKAKALDISDDPIVQTLISQVITQLQIPIQSIYGVYLNYYRNGNDYTPNHSHPGTRQIVISLGGTRTFKLGSKIFPVSNGDVCIFGSTTHGVPKDHNVTTERISIALFTQ